MLRAHPWNTSQGETCEQHLKGWQLFLRHALFYLPCLNLVLVFSPLFNKKSVVFHGFKWRFLMTTLRNLVANKSVLSIDFLKCYLLDYVVSTQLDSPCEYQSVFIWETLTSSSWVLHDTSSRLFPKPSKFSHNSRTEILRISLSLSKALAVSRTLNT